MNSLQLLDAVEDYVERSKEMHASLRQAFACLSEARFLSRTPIDLLDLRMKAKIYVRGDCEAVEDCVVQPKNMQTKEAQQQFQLALKQMFHVIQARNHLIGCLGNQVR